MARVVKGVIGRNIPRYQRHGADHHVVADADLVGHDAAIGAQTDIVANAQCILGQAKRLDADRAVLANEKVAPDVHVAGYHDARQVGDAQAWGNLRANVDVHRVLEVEPLLHAPGMAPAQAAAGIKVLGQAVGEEKAQLVVLARSAQNVEEQANAAPGFFLVGDLLSPAFQQGFKVHAVGPVQSAVYHAAL